MTYCKSDEDIWHMHMSNIKTVHTPTLFPFIKTFLSCPEDHNHSARRHVCGLICLASHHHWVVPSLSPIMPWVILSLFEHASHRLLLNESQTDPCGLLQAADWPTWASVLSCWVNACVPATAGKILLACRPIDSVEMLSRVATTSCWSALLGH